MNILEKLFGRGKKLIARLNQEIVQLHQRGQYEQAIDIATQVCDLAHQYLGESHPGFANSLDNLANLYETIGNYTEAVSIYLHALEISCAALGENHPDIARRLNWLAGLYEDMRNYTAAEPLYLQAQEIFRTTLGEKHPIFVTGLNNVSRFYDEMSNFVEHSNQQKQEIPQSFMKGKNPDFVAILEKFAQLQMQMGRLHAAGPFYRRALEIRRRTLGKNHRDLVKNSSNLAELYKAMGNNTAAEALLLEALETTRTAQGKECPDFALVLLHLAGLYKSMHNYAKAESFYRQSLEIMQRTLGIGHQNTGACLNNLADLYYTVGNYSEALSLQRQAFEIARKTFGESHPIFVTNLHNLAKAYFEMSDYAAAEPLYQKALEIQRTISGDKHPSFTRCLLNLAGLYRSMSNYAAAEPLLKQALEITFTTSGKEHPDFAATLTQLALLYEAKGDYVAAEPFFQKAIDIYRRAFGEDHQSYVSALNNLAGLYETMGNFPAAESLYQQSLKIRQKTIGENHPDFAKSLNDLAVAYHAMGNFTAAEPLYRQATEIYCATLGENHPEFATCLKNLARLYEKKGNYAAAVSLYQQALGIMHKVFGEEHPKVSNINNTLVNLYRSTGINVVSDLLIEGLKKAPKPEDPNLVRKLHEIAEVSRWLGDHATVERLYQQALEDYRATFGQEHPDYGLMLNELAEHYRRMGDYTAAEPLYQQALEILRKAQMEGHSYFASMLNNLALLYKAMGKYAAAEPLYLQSLEILKKTNKEHHPNFVYSLQNLAGLYMVSHREAEAMTLMKEAALATDRIIGQSFSIFSDELRMAHIRRFQFEDYAFLTLISQPLSHSLAAAQDGLELVLRRKAIGVEASAAQRDLVLGGRYPMLKTKLEELTNLRFQIAQKTLAGPGMEDISTQQQLLFELKHQRDNLEMELVRQIPEMNLEQKLRAADRQAITKVLPEGSILIEFVRFLVLDFKAVPARGDIPWKPAHYLAFVLSAQESDNVKMIDLGEAEPIDKMIATFRASITGEAENRNPRHLIASPKAKSINNGAALRAAIFDPLIPALGGRRRLFLAPDGDLNRLPFEVLPIGDGRRLIDDYQISYLGTGRDVLRFGAAINRQPAEPIVAADPDFDFGGDGARIPVETSAHGRRSHDLNRNSLHFDRLLGTRLEGECIAALLGVQPLLENKVLEAKLKGCRSPRILHIATHGFFLPDQKDDLNKEQFGLRAIGDRAGRLLGPGLENPLLRSGLALAGANTWLQEKLLPPEAEDGILTAEDVSGMDLLDTDLVVLSACETGLGEVQVGEGVFGLRRAFVLAGAKTLVMSLWKVPDQQTQELMEDFYRRILEGQPRAEALRQAQLAMKAKYPDPYYWGAFICQGDPGPLPKRQQS